MAHKFYYQRAVKMAPREGVQYATTYYKQTLKQRQDLTHHIRYCLKEMIDYLEANPKELAWAQTTRLKGFPKTKGGNRTMWEIILDMVGEAQGMTRQGLPKDYAQAPIERWNKLFAGTDYEFEMREGSPAGDLFNQVFEINNA
jgi:hypothetical protein